MLFSLLSGCRSEPLVLFVLCTTGRRQPQWGDSGGYTGNNRKEQGSDMEAVGGGVLVARDSIKTFVQTLLHEENACSSHIECICILEFRGSCQFKAVLAAMRTFTSQATPSIQYYNL